MSNAMMRWDPFKDLGRWDPFREIDELQGRLATLFGRAPLRRQGEREEGLTLAEWAPPVDIIEDEKEYLIKADLPEVRKEDLKVSVQDNVLSINGERVLQREEKNKKYHRVERAYGAFSRSFTLPRDADGAKVSADFKEGILKVRVPKSEAARARHVDIKVG